MISRLTPRVFALAAAVLAAQTFAARAEEPSSASLSLAAAIIADVGLKASVDGEIPNMAGQIQNNLLQLHPEMQSSLHDTLVALLPEFQKSDSAVLGDLAHVMASKMSEQELRDTQVFFESSTGKKYLAVQPVLLQELGISGNVWRQKLATDMLNRVREEMKKKGFQF